MNAIPNRGPSEAVLLKAQRLVEENRVYLSRRHSNLAAVCGDTDHYEVWASEEGVQCECYADSAPRPVPRCSHAVAAMVAWWERDEAAVRPVDADEPASGFAALLAPAL